MKARLCRQLGVCLAARALHEVGVGSKILARPRVQGWPAGAPIGQMLLHA
jgi:hypothetical protein